MKTLQPQEAIDGLRVRLRGSGTGSVAEGELVLPAFVMLAGGALSMAALSQGAGLLRWGPGVAGIALAGAAVWRLVAAMRASRTLHVGPLGVRISGKHVQAITPWDQIARADVMDQVLFLFNASDVVTLEVPATGHPAADLEALAARIAQEASSRKVTGSQDDAVDPRLKWIRADAPRRGG